jgi:hypothetical protein
MLTDFLPAIVTVAILAGAFIFVWSSDVRKTRRLEAPDPAPASVDPVVDGEQVSMSPE